jgi:hypothetical protein
VACGPLPVDRDVAARTGLPAARGLTAPSIRAAFRYFGKAFSREALVERGRASIPPR